MSSQSILVRKDLKLIKIPTDNGSKQKFVALITILSFFLRSYQNMKVVIFEKKNVKIKRKKAQPSKEYSTVGNRDNKIALLIAEDGHVYLKAVNPQTGLVYIYSNIKSYARPEVNRTNAKGVHVVLLVPSLKPDPSPYIFIFPEEEDAFKFNSCLSLAAKAAMQDDLYDADTIGGASVSTVESDSDDDDEYEEFNPTQDFNTGAQALAQELMASYK